MPAPIGEPRRMPNRGVSASVKIDRDNGPWNAEPDWSGWSRMPVANGPRQLTGTASLGVVYNDQSQWTNVRWLNMADVEFPGSPSFANS